MPYASANASAVAIAQAAETVAVTTPGIAMPPGGGVVHLFGWVNVTIPATTTALQLRLRRASVTGSTVVAETAESVTASTQRGFTIMQDDTPGEAAGLVYVLTVLFTGAGAGGTAAQAYLAANWSSSPEGA